MMLQVVVHGTNWLFAYTYEENQNCGVFYDSVNFFFFFLYLQVVYEVSFLRLGYKMFPEIPTVSGQPAIPKSGIGCWKKKSLIKKKRQR